MNSRLIVCFMSTLLLGTSFSGKAYAQPRNTDDILSFTSHKVDYNSTVGVPFGGLMLTPGVTFRQVYDDNIFLKKENKTHDFITSFKPGLALQSNWGRHELFAGLQLNKTKYRWNSQKDTLEYGGIISGAYDITHGTYIDAYLKKGRQSLNRGSEDDIDGTLPIEYDNLSSRIGFTRALSYIQAEFAAFYESSERKDSLSTAVAGDFLTRDKTGAEATLTYEFLPDTNLFLSLSHAEIEYDIVGNTERTIDKTELRYGFNFSYWDLYSGSLYFGNMHTSYSDIDKTQDDPAFGIDLKWSPLKLTDVSFNLGRMYTDGNLTSDEKVIIDNMKLGVAHQFTEFVNGNLYASDASYEYQNLTGSTLRDNNLYSYGADVGYQLSDNLDMKLGYDYRHRVSENIDDEYLDNRFMFTLSYMH